MGAELQPMRATVVSEPGGPLIVQRQNAGIVGRSMAGAGAAIAGAGRSIQRGLDLRTAEAREAEEKTQKLDRARQASRIVREQSQALEAFRVGLRANSDTDTYGPAFEALQAETLHAVEQIADDEVKTAVQVKLDDRLTLIAADMQGYRQQVRLDNWQSEYDLAVDAAVRGNDISLVSGPLEMLADNDPLITEADKAERLAEVADRIAIWNHAKELGWEEGLKYVNDEATWAGTHLEPDEIAELKAKLQGNLQTDQTLASLADRRAAAEITANDTQLIAAAYAGELDAAGLTTARETFEAGGHTKAIYSEVMKLAAQGPPPANDPAIYQEALSKVADAQADPSQRDKTLLWLRSHISDLKPATFESLSARAFAAEDPANPLGAPVVKLLDGLIDDTYKAGGFGQFASSAAEAQYIDAKERFMAFARSHPDATDADFNAEYRRLVEPVAKPHWYDRIREAFWHPVGAEIDWGSLSWAPMPAGLPDEPLLTTTFEQVDEDVAPESVDDFYRVLDSLPVGSQAEKDYYEKWASRWE